MDRLRIEALNLPDAERAGLACDLVCSLDGPPDANVAKEWDAEILRRLDETESGNAEVIDRAEFARRMRKSLTQL
ncbi:MAG: addiction module protein [Steroidobacteraceae bacterium]